jgi:hypothetical protein
MGVSLNKTKSACRIGDEKTMLVPAARVNRGALQADWRHSEPIRIITPADIIARPGILTVEKISYGGLLTSTLQVAPSLRFSPSPSSGAFAAGQVKRQVKPDGAYSRSSTIHASLRHYFRNYSAELARCDADTGGPSCSVQSAVRQSEKERSWAPFLQIVSDFPVQ